MTTLTCWKATCAACLLFVATAIGAAAQTFTTLAYFSDGSTSYSSLIQGRDGNLYGTSNNGGAAGDGAVFKVTPTGTLTTLYSFCSQAGCSDGSYPFSVLALGTDGNFYGTTQNGGVAGMGTVFKITPSGAYTVLHSFAGTDGSAPEAGLVLGGDGNFYGTTSSGGTSGGCACGTVFKISATGVLTTLHTFNGSDGAIPSAPLVLGTDGSYHGTTYSGGSSNSCNGGSCGTAFKITPSGALTSLHSFQFTDGSKPVAPLVETTAGAYYGTTLEGGDEGFQGCGSGCGTVFKISSGGAFASIHKFDFTDGGAPDSGLVQGTDGNIYGESPDGGQGDGEIYKLTLPRTVATDYSFPTSSGGGGITALLQGTNGKFYGTYGDPSAVFSYDVGLGPFVAFVRPTGKVGQTAQILGQGLTGASSVAFGGISATSFEVVSDTYMTAVVPSGATTGAVVVTTPTGTLTSNINFRIAK
jgi:uncharacterized repeat protein (TIGR03803 family)